jgi:hypothetical protein
MSETSVAEAGPAAPAIESGPDIGYHFADISPAEAEAVNDGVDIVAYGCVHGMLPKGEGDPTQVETAYDAAANVVAGLDPARGDILFTESANHEGPLPGMLTVFSKDEAHSILDYMRAERTIDPLLYAIALAEIKGVQVVPADMSKVATEHFEDVIGELVRPLDRSWPFFSTYHALRVEQASNTIKDYARAHVSLSPWSAEKPVYALLFGPAHVDEPLASATGMMTVADAFGQLGLNVKIERLPSADDTPEQNSTDALTTQIRNGAFAGSLALSGVKTE